MLIIEELCSNHCTIWIALTKKGVIPQWSAVQRLDERIVKGVNLLIYIYFFWPLACLKPVSLGVQVPSYIKPCLLSHWLTGQLPYVSETFFIKSKFATWADLDHNSHFVDLRVNPVFFYLLILAGCPWGSWAVSSFTPLQRENIGLLCIIKQREEERKSQQWSYSRNIQRLIISPLH